MVQRTAKDDQARSVEEEEECTEEGKIREKHGTICTPPVVSVTSAVDCHEISSGGHLNILKSGGICAPSTSYIMHRGWAAQRPKPVANQSCTTLLRISLPFALP